MKVIQIDRTNPDVEAAIRSLRIVEKPLPKPRRGQVLVKIEAAPCNPSDLLFLQGKYGMKKKLPAVPGWEGAGTVVASGGGALGWWLKGKRVACGGQSESDGTWAEYYLADAKACIPLREHVSSEQGACLIINPLTAVGMVERASSERHRAIIQTAACSQVGRMVQTLARLRKIPLINIVRKQEQVQELQAAGERWVCESTDPGFEEKLKKAAYELQATVAFEAVAGSMTGVVLRAMPPKSTVLVYGALSEQPCGEISSLSLIFERKTVEGFWLSQWIKESGFWHTYKTTRLVQHLIESGGFQTKIRSSASFEGWKSALLDYHRTMTSGKAILLPSAPSL